MPIAGGARSQLRETIMTPTMVVELVYFSGCPHVDRARHALRDALKAAGLPEHWKEWNQFDPSSPERVQGYASPTILVAGQDVSGDGPTVVAPACRIDGLASAEAIRAVLLITASSTGRKPAGRVQR